MRHNPAFAVTDPEVVRELIRRNPWATIVSGSEGEIVASHYPLLLDEEGDELAILTHVGRPDEELHGLGGSEVLCIVQGSHGYVSPSWYSADAPPVPTWNFTVAHCYGVPRLLDEAENLRTLTALVERFEREVAEPLFLDPTYGAQVAKGTVGIRIPVSRFVCKRKLSQNRDLESRRAAITALRAPGPYRHPQLADEMERELEADAADGAR